METGNEMKGKPDKLGFFLFGLELVALAGVIAMMLYGCAVSPC